MRLEKLRIVLISAGFLLVVFLSLSLISADSCNIETSASCSGRGGYSIMELSDTSNAHGALNTQSSYSYVLCCDFGTGDTACTGSNKFIGLSDLTNAHAEAPSYTNYGNPVCYESLSCRQESVLSTCNSGEIEMLSLSADTNAHIANFSGTGSYSTKICCDLGCEQFQTNTTCREYTPKDCTWTPPTATGYPQGGCCEPNEEWDQNEQICVSVTMNICNTGFWDPLNQFPGITVWPNYNPTLLNPWTEYCAQISNDVSYGLRYNPTPY